MKNFLFTIILLPLITMKPLHAGVADDVDVKRVQTSLTKLCLNPGPIDGLWGRKTENAAKQFLKGQKKTFSGTFTKDNENTLWGVVNTREIQASFASGSVELCDVKKFNAKQNITIYDSWSIPEYVKPDPNLETLRHYFKKEYAILKDREIGKYRVKPKNNHEPFSRATMASDLIESELNKSSILSYLYLDQNNLIYDYKSPKERLGDIYNDDTHYISNSIGKSIVSYVLGHAICEGFIDSIDVKINDWPIIQNTLYHNQSLIDLLNMSAGDTKYVDDHAGMIGTNRWYNVHTIKSLAERELANSEPTKRKRHHYNGLITNIILNYVVHKTNYEFQHLIDKVFQETVKIENDIYFLVNKYDRTDRGRIIPRRTAPQDGTVWYQVYATRYDYLRIAKAMLHDWKHDTCVGKYLKEISMRKVPQKRFMDRDKGGRFSHRSYAGQFHLDYHKLEDRNIFGLEGYGGQATLIDFDNERIVSIVTVHTDYNFRNLVIDVIRLGK